MTDTVQDGFLRAPAAAVDGYGALSVAVTSTVPSTAPATATVTQVASSATNVTLKVANTARRGLYVFNDSTSVLNLKLGATASLVSFTVKVAAGGYYELPAPVYSGIVDGIWVAANGNAYVTEVV